MLDKMTLLVAITAAVFCLMASPSRACPPGCPCPPSTSGAQGAAGAAASVDPNALTGPAGFGPEHFVPSGILLAYRIDFENDAKASAPAQQVDITNQLDTNLDWSTFEITEVGFGDQFIAIPPGSRTFQHIVPDTFEGTSFEVHIQVGINPATGLVSAKFLSIDPETGWTPPVNVGFLPPEDGTGRGMGHISYTVRHRPEVPERTEIRNIALIVFDMGEHIRTNQVDPHEPSKGTDPAKEAPVTIDKDGPLCRITSLPESSGSVFNVRWSGSDGASGIAGYDVHVRDGQAVAWQLWQKATAATSANFHGTPGHSYEFYCEAVDNVGHREQKPPVPEAQTAIPASGLYGFGDLDNDGDIDGADLAGFSRALGAASGNTAFPPAADITGDGLLNTRDAQFFATFFGLNVNASCQNPAADLNQDGKSNQDDLLILARALGSKAGASTWTPLADLNHDGIIDGKDITAFRHLLPCAP